jgi:uncharacterized protein YdeI (YjbR/CyaY-like superfamily)
MGKKDPRVDAYIASAEPFARPILKHLRKLVHQGCPDAEETIKWGFPHFDHHGIMVSMAAFKQHAVFGFWQHTLVTGGKTPKGEAAMGSFGRITSKQELPSDAAIVRMVRKAAALNASGVKALRVPKAAPKPAPKAPADPLAALAKNRKAKATFDAFPPSHRREYVEWIVEAKRPETRARRLETAIEWMAAGKARDWKYAR